MRLSGWNWCLEVTVMSKFAVDPKSALSIFPVQHAYSFTSYLGWSGLHCKGDVFLQGTEFLVRLSLERIGKHTAVGMGIK